MVFQPLLMENFDSEELVEMKHLVIKLHLLQRKHYHNNDSKIDLKKDKVRSKYYYLSDLSKLKKDKLP